MKISLSILFAFFFIFSVSAQEKSAPKKKKQKKIPENIEFINSKFSFSPIYLDEYSYFQIRSRKNDEAGEMNYKPNITGSIGAKIGFKKFSVSYLYALPQSEDFGKTQSTNLIFNYQKRVFGLQLYWIRYNGLYIDTLNRYKLYNDMYAHGVDSAFIIRDDIKLNNIGFKNYFIFRKKFSVNAAFEQNERQKKTAGSFVLMYGANYTNIENNKGKSLILPSQKDYYPRVYDIYKLNTLAFKIAPGIGYSFIIKRNFNFSFILLAGPDIQYRWYKLDNYNRTRFGPWISLYYEGKTAIGYNGKIFTFNLIYGINHDVIGFKKTYRDQNDCTTGFYLFREYIKLTFGIRIY